MQISIFFKIFTIFDLEIIFLRLCSKATIQWGNDVYAQYEVLLIIVKYQNEFRGWLSTLR